MAGLKQIKTKIRSVEKSRQVTKAMEAVSAAKMRKAQIRAINGRSYARAAVAVLARVSGSREMGNHILSHERPVNHALYIVITSDKGLAGTLNSGVLSVTLADIEGLQLPKSAVSIVAIGRKAADYFVARGYHVERTHFNTDSVTSEVIRELVNTGVGRFGSGVVDLVKMSYQNMISTFEQRS